MTQSAELAAKLEGRWVEGGFELAANGSEDSAGKETASPEREKNDETADNGLGDATKSDEDSDSPRKASSCGGPEFFTFEDNDESEEEAEDVFEQVMHNSPLEPTTSRFSKRMVLLVICGLLTTALLSWCGLRAHARYEVEQLKTQVHQLKQLQTEVQQLEEMRLRYQELEASVKAQARGPESDSAASLEQKAGSAEGLSRCSDGQCKNDAASESSEKVNVSKIQRPAVTDASQDGQQQQHQQLPGAAVEEGRRTQDGEEAATLNADSVDGSQVQRLSRAPAAGVQAQEETSALNLSQQPELAPVAPASDSAFPDLTCVKTQYEEWRVFKSLLQENIGTWSSGGASQSTRIAHMQTLVESASEMLEPVYYNVEECGMGRLSMTLLGMASGVAGGSVVSVTSLHSPMLTLLLDIPWKLLLQSGWPFFGLLAQLQLQSNRLDDLPHTGPTKEYFKVFSNAFAEQDVGKLAKSGSDFLQRNTEKSNALPLLCALASQLLVLDPDGGEGDSVLTQLQVLFRQVVHSIDDLQATLDSVWPLYGLVHVTSRINAGKGEGAGQATPQKK